MAEYYLGEEIKKLGFGLMRLPKTGGEFDLNQIKEIVRSPGNTESPS